MSPNAIIRFLVAISMIAGLLIAPASFAGPAKAAHETYGTMTDMAASSIGEMPCCPKKPVVPDCPKCPLMALCAPVFVEQDAAIDLFIPQPVARQREMPSDALLSAGLDSAPLPEPPRSTV